MLRRLFGVTCSYSHDSSILGPIRTPVFVYVRFTYEYIHKLYLIHLLYRLSIVQGQKLEDAECAEKGLVKMLFEE